jgi:hypothetical protein
MAREGQSRLTFNGTAWEERGGRRMCWHIPGYAGRSVLSRDACKSIPAKFLLQAIPRVLRPAFTGDQWYIDVDLGNAHLAAAAALAGDQQLQHDLLSSDVHQVVGDALAGSAPDVLLRRKIGKATNSALLCGGSWLALRHELAQHGLAFQDHVVERFWQAWWTRYPQLQAFRDWWWSGAFYTGALRKGITVVRPDGLSYRLSPSELDGGHPRYEPFGSQLERRRAAFRSTLSSLWRAVEAAIMDRTFELLQGEPRQSGFRICLPMFDGLLGRADEQTAQKATQAAARAVAQAAAEAGIETRVKTATGRAWPQ